MIKNDKYAKFPIAVKKEAVRKVREGEPMRKVSSDTGCNIETLRNWIKIY